jgi:hypothetical protein
MLQPFALVALVVVAACGRRSFDVVDGDVVDGDVVDGDVVDAQILPILHLTFDSGRFLVDEVGNLVPTCTGCPTQVAGHLGQAAQFDGTTSCLTMPDVPALRPPAFTISLWLFAPSAQGANATVVSRSLDGATEVSNTITFAIHQSDLWYFEITGVATTRPVASGAWHHFAGVYDGTQLAMYVDGIQLDPGQPAPLTYGADNLRIGCDFDRGAEANKYAGVVDDLRFYDLALGSGAISALSEM